MNKIILAILLLVSFNASSQYLAPLDAKNSGARSVGILVTDSMQNMRFFDTATCKLAFPSKLAGRIARQSGRLYYNPSGTKFILLDSVVSSGGSSYTFTSPLSESSGVVSIDLSNYATTSQLANKVNYTDTGLMLTPYALITELPNISGKLNISDTATMLSPYATDANVALKLNITDTANIRMRPIAGANMAITGTYPNLTFASSAGGGAFYDSVLMATNYRVDTAKAAIRASIPSTSGLVPYTGATSDVNLGSNGISAHDATINYSSGSGAALSVTKSGNGEGLTVVKSSGSGNAASITGGVTLLDELHLNTDLADAYIASAAAWNAKQSPSDTTTWDATKQNLADTSAVLRSLIPTVVSAASVAEINTGTDNAKFASPLGLAGSKYLDQSGTKVSGTTAGTSTAYTLTLSPAITAYTDGLSLWVKFHVANTGAATINVNGLGAKSLVKDISTALVANDIPINQWYTIVYNGTNFLIQDIGFGGINLSARLSGALSDETGTGVAVFGTSPSFTTSVVGGATFAAFNTTTTNLSLGGAATTMTIGGTPTTALTHTYSGNATANTITKTINFGTGGASGSTTAINIGSTTSGATNNVKLNITPASDATGDLFYRNASGFLTRLGIGTTGQVLTVAAGLPSWATGGGGGGSYWEFGTTGNVISSNQIFGSTTGSSGTYNIDFRLKDEVLMRLGRISTGERFGYFMSRGTSVTNYDSWWVGGETNSATGIRAGGINGVGGVSSGTGSLSINGGQAQATNAIAAMSTSTYANGDNSTAWGGYANNANFTGCFNISDFSETTFSNNTANNQFVAKYAGGFQFKTAAATTRMTIKSTGIVNISNTPTYADNTAALAGGLVAGDVYRTSTGVLMITY